MTRKSALAPFISALMFASSSFAGGMGDTSSSYCCSAFALLEGGYTWNSLNGYNFTLSGANSSVVSTSNDKQWTGRLAAGMITMMDDQFGVTGEVGWGYYGRTTFDPEASGFFAQIPGSLSIGHTITGFDALVGVSFVQPYYTLFLKGGALIENLHTSVDAQISPFGLPLLDTFSLETNNTTVLPEIKLGAAYNFTNNWALTAAYAFVWGGSPQTTGDLNVNTLRANLSINNENPTLNTVLVGIQYTT